MPSHKFESDKLSAISQKTKNKVGDTRKSLEDSSSWLLGMSAQDITSIANHIKDVNSQVTQSLIDDTKKYWKAETDAYNTFINHVDKTSKRKVTNSSVYGELSGASSTNRSTAKTSSPPPISNDTSINNLSKGLDRHAKSFEKSTKLLTTALTALTSGLSRAVRESASIMRDRYNSVVFATGGGSQADAIYNAVAESNRDLAMELFKNGTNTISAEEFTRSFQSVTTYFKQDQKLITAMTSQVAQAAEVGMTVNTEFLKTSAYMYKQSGKNEKSIKSMTDSIYELSTKSEVSLQDTQEMAMSSFDFAINLENTLRKYYTRQGLSPEEAEKKAEKDTLGSWKDRLATESAMIDANPEKGAEAFETIDSLLKLLSTSDVTQMTSEQLTMMQQLTGSTSPESLSIALATDYESVMNKIMESIEEDFFNNPRYDAELTALGFDSKSLPALSEFSTSIDDYYKEFKENRKALESESRDSIIDALKNQKVSEEDNITNTMSEVVTDTIPARLLDISDDLATLVSVVTGSSLLNTGISLLTQVPGGLPGAYNSIKSFLTGSKSGIPLPNTKMPPIPGADLADDALSGSSNLLSKIPGLSKLSGVASKAGSALGKVAPVLSIASIIGNGIQGLTGEKTYSKVFGLDNPDDMTTGQRAAGTVGSMIGGGHEGGLGNALGQAATWGAVGSLAGPVGTLVGAISGGIAGLLGSDRIAKSIETNINGPLGRIGESLQNGGDDLVSSVVDLSTAPYNIVSDLFSGLGDMASNIPIIGGLLESGADLIATSNSKVGDTISLLGDGVQGALDLLNGTAKASDVLNTITSDLDNVLGDIPIVGSVWNGLHDLSDWLFGSDDKKDDTKGRPGFSYGGAHPGVPNLPNIGTTKPNGDIDGPSPWIVTAGFHDWSIGYGSHDGVDYGVPIGTQVPSTTDGTVTYLTENDGTNWGGGPGKGVIITDSQGRQHWYWHLSKIGVSKGQQLKKGTLVGLSGNTGMSTGPHLHYGLKVNGSAINPNVTAPGLWGEVTGSMSSNPSSSSSAESDIKNYIVTSDGGKFRMDYNYGSGGIPSNILSGMKSKSRFMHSRNIGSAISPSSTYVSNNWTPNITNTNTTLKSDNSEVVAELRQLISLLNYKLDRLNNTISNGYKQSSVEDFSLAY